MVYFNDIKLENGIITAIAIDSSTGITETITASMDGTYHSSSNRWIIQATWNLISDYERDGKLPTKRNVYWY